MKDYGMFTDEGNALIHGVVISARTTELDWRQVCEILYDISTLDGFEEASDTSVREAVHTALVNA